jgi:hypothetical protein
VNILVVSLLVLVGLLFVLEAGLRWLFGFGNPLLYLADQEMGYLLAPNQRTKRFGNRIAINEYSMRSATMTRTRPPFNAAGSVTGRFRCEWGLVD